VSRRGPEGIRGALRRFHRDEGGQSLAIILTLVTVLFLMGSALATHASVALRATVANEEQAGDLHGADAGAELGMWWQRHGMAGNPPSITMNGLTVNTTIAVSGAVSCAPASPTTVTGFEHGVVSAAGGGLFSTVTGAGVTADSGVVRSGSHSLRIVDPTGSNHSARIAVGAGVSVVRIYVRLASLPAADVTELLSVDAATGSDLRIGYQASSGRLTIRFGNAAVTTAATAISADTWYRLSLRVDVNADPRTADWQIDGAPQTSVSWAGAASTVNTVRVGSSVNADAYTANYDDVIISASSGDYPLGDGRVVGLRPNGMGTSVNPASFAHDDGSPIDPSTHLRVDEDPMDSTADYVRQGTIGSGDYIELSLADTAATCIVGVRGIVAYHAQGTALDNGRATVFDGTTERVIFSGDMSQTTLQYASTIIPPPSGSWTASAVSALTARIGYSSDVTPNPYWDALMLEVATGNSQPGTVTVVSTAGGSSVTATYTDVGSASPTLLSWSTTQ
jgi:hypothetical protein